MTDTNIAEFKQPEKKSLVETFANKLGVEAGKLLPALKQTAFQTKGQEISDSQMLALLVVANQYDLNPFTKEIFAYPDKGGIVPVVSVDGWSRIINENPNMDGMEFTYSENMVDFNGHQCHEWIECSIYRKDRSRPTTVREYFDEVKRELNYANPWKTHPKRMHRHKTLIQAARVAFGFAGIYDQDEAERIVEADKGKVSPTADLVEPYTEGHKQYYDQLLEEGNAIEMYVFSQTISEGIWIALYGSFEQGKKMESKKRVNELVEEGQAKIVEFAQVFNEACESNDESMILELIDGLSEDAIQLILDKVSLETASFYREIAKEIDDADTAGE